MQAKTKFRTVSVPSKLIERIEKVSEQTKEFTSIAEFVRNAIRALLEKYEERS